MAVPRPASLARRALPALAIAGLSGGLLVKLDNPAPASASGGLDAASPTTRAGRATTTDAPDDTVAAPSTTRPRTTSTTAATARTTVPTVRTTPTTSAVRPSASTAAPATRATAAPTVPATAAPAPAEPVDAAACDAEPVAGPTVSTRWGPVQVAAVFTADGSLCDVQVLQYPTDHRKSVAINQRALPVLTREAVAAGSADIDIVTGATITSDAYATSLQAVLDGHG